ncbi:Haloacid dehalogenase-like hydrolase domain-containing protein 3 [Perkinsus chesapeaki]|uniref:Haloacid dehalogenase-like hydrolase domain-containing protein 3 n=1 Tax=Perkinsus chesapeaki TaxID=330153 RepID=A0A7J6N378_PERCH|nr:Haloacid dehalogenase-like hydrolase domain-containing protein 3 [Perkinsus chesapeaki]
MIRCITTECIPTLIGLRRPVHIVYHAAMKRFGLEVEEEDVKRAYAHGFKTVQARYPNFSLTRGGGQSQATKERTEGKKTLVSLWRVYMLPSELAYYKDWWRLSVLETLNAPGMPATGWSAEQFDIFFQYIFSEFGSVRTWQAQPGAKDFLMHCQGQGIITGLLDNSYARYIDDTLPLCDGLHEALHFAVLGGDYDPPLVKPSLAAFQEALRKANVARGLFDPTGAEIVPEEMMHLGNRLNGDYAGARRAGWRAFLVDPTGAIREKLRRGEVDLERLGCSLSPDDVVVDLKEALSVMQGRGLLR